MKMDYPIVKITWEDHYEEQEWHDVEGYSPQSYYNVTVGFLVKKTRKHYTVARTVSGSGQVDGVMNIIRKNVTMYEEIRF
jgi:hypothetical protein